MFFEEIIQNQRVLSCLRFYELKKDFIENDGELRRLGEVPYENNIFTIGVEYSFKTFYHLGSLVKIKTGTEIRNEEVSFKVNGFIYEELRNLLEKEYFLGICADVIRNVNSIKLATEKLNIKNDYVEIGGMWFPLRIEIPKLVSIVDDISEEHFEVNGMWFSIIKLPDLNCEETFEEPIGDKNSMLTKSKEKITPSDWRSERFIQTENGLDENNIDMSETKTVVPKDIKASKGRKVQRDMLCDCERNINVVSKPDLSIDSEMAVVNILKKPQKKKDVIAVRHEKSETATSGITSPSTGAKSMNFTTNGPKFKTALPKQETLEESETANKWSGLSKTNKTGEQTAETIHKMNKEKKTGSAEIDEEPIKSKYALVTATNTRSIYDKEIQKIKELDQLKDLVLTIKGFHCDYILLSRDKVVVSGIIVFKLYHRWKIESITSWLLQLHAQKKISRKFFQLKF